MLHSWLTLPWQVVKVVSPDHALHVRPSVYKDKDRSEDILRHIVLCADILQGIVKEQNCSKQTLVPQQ